MIRMIMISSQLIYNGLLNMKTNILTFVSIRPHPADSAIFGHVELEVQKDGISIVELQSTQYITVRKANGRAATPERVHDILQIQRI